MKKGLLATALIWVANAVAAPTIMPVAPKLVDGCYQIGTAEELYGFAAIANGTNGMTRNKAACGKLTANIVVNKNVLANDTLNGDDSNFVPWTPIEEFSGTIDGQYHTISGLYMSKDHDEAEWVAPILSVRPAKSSDTITIKNIGIEDSYIYNNRYAAGFIATVDSGTVAMTNVYYASFIRGRYDTAGGLIGEVKKGSLFIKNTYTFVPRSIVREACLVGDMFSGTKSESINSYTPSELNLMTGINALSIPYTEFTDGSLALRLHNYDEGNAWGQNVGVDNHPTFSGKVTNYASNLKVSSLTFNTGFEHEPFIEGYVEGEITPLPIPTKEGYAFIGWFEDKEFTGDTILTINRTMTGDKELYAMWATLPKLVNGCYEIGTASELYGFAAIVNGTNGTKRESCACGKLTTNISVSEKFVEFSTYKRWFPMMEFCGTFDGNGKTISGLTYLTNGSIGNIGFFGTTKSKYISYNEQYRAVIKDLEIADAYFQADTCIGTLIGNGRDVDIINVHTTGSVHGRYAIGGIAGQLSNSNITHTINEAGGDARAAGGAFIGVSHGTIRITNSYNKGHVTPNNDGCCSSSNKPAVQVVGYNYGTTIFENSYHMPTKYWDNDRATLDGVTAINSFYDGSYVGKNGTHVTTHEFNDGTVAKLLREYKTDNVDGSIWGQNVGVDESPVFVDKLVFSSTITPKAPKQTNGCYQIGTIEELFGFANIVNAALYNITPFCAELTSDIVLNKDVRANEKGAIQWIPIKDFDGTFDGQGHTISGIYFKDTTVTNAGLFASIINRDPLSPTTIKNLNTTDSFIHGGLNTGALVGEIDSLSQKVSIENCQVEATVGNSYINNAKPYIGGLVGNQHGGELTITQSSSVGDFFGYGSTGGLIGIVTGKSNIINSYNVATISNAFNFYNLVGSISGSYYSGTTLFSPQVNVENSYALVISSKNKELTYVHLMRGNATFKNVFYYLYSGSAETNGQTLFKTSEEQIKDGSLATALHTYKSETADGSVWGQKIGTDEYPKLTGNITGATSVKSSSLKLVTYDTDTTTYRDKYVEGLESLLPIPERKDYVFKGWFSNKDYSGSPVKFIPNDATGDLTYYAQWWHNPSIVNNCYEIGDIGELYQFADMYNSEAKHTSTCVKLTANIIDNKNVLVNGKINEADSAKFKKWTPIKNFIGTFDGQGHTISGLFVSSSADGVGLFGSIGLKREVGEKAPVTKTVIQNINIKDSYFYGNKYVGSLIGRAESASILSVINISSESNINANSNHAGGIIGYYGNDEGPDEGIELNIVNVHHDGETFGLNCVGGIAGSILYAKSTIINASNTGATLGYGGIGGLVGQIISYDTSKSTMMYSYNEGFVSSINAAVGGLVAFQKYFLDLYNSYNVGNVQAGTFKSGGIIGQTDGILSIVNTYNKGIVSAEKDSLVDALVAETGENSEVSLNNTFYVNTAKTTQSGTAASATEFTDLSLAKKLHDYNKNGINGDVWGQETGDAYPHFKKNVVEEFAAAYIKTLNLEIAISSSSSVNSSSSTAQSSSSSAKSSSSSVNSSSSVTVSSSSEESSSSAKSSSSSAKSSSSSKIASSSSSSAKSCSSAKSSSSSAKSSSSVTVSSSSKGTGLEKVRSIAKLHIAVEPNFISIHGAQIGANVTLLDMQGRVLYRHHAVSSDFNIAKPAPGSYIIHIMNKKQIVTIR